MLSKPAPPKARPRKARDRETHRARRRKADQAERKDSFILHKFEALLTWAEFINLNRRVEDDDTDDAKKAADDQDEIGSGQISKAPATRLKLHLDLAPEDVDREALSGMPTYPEWDVRTGAYLNGSCPRAGLAESEPRRHVACLRRSIRRPGPASAP